MSTRRVKPSIDREEGYAASTWERIKLHFEVVAQNFNTHPVVLKMRMMNLRKATLPMATFMILAPLVSTKFPTGPLHYTLFITALIFTAQIWIGSFFAHRRSGMLNQMIGASGLLVVFSLIVGSFLPFPMQWTCWVTGLLFLVPLFDVILRPCRGAPVPAPPRVVE